MTKPRKINVEPLLFIHGFGLGLLSTVGVAFITFKHCLWLLDSSVQALPNPHEYCLRLGSDVPHNSQNGTRPEEDADLQFLNRVQAATARFTIIQEAISVAPTTIMTIFVGTWSDKYGRKTPLVIALASSAVGSQISVAVAAMDSIPVYFLLIATFISSITGASLVIHSNTFSMIADAVTNPAQLTIRIALAAAVSSIGSFAAQVSAGFILQRWDDYALMQLCHSGFQVLGFLYAVFVLQETIQFSFTRMQKRSINSAILVDPVDPSMSAVAAVLPNSKIETQEQEQEHGCKSFISGRIMKECLRTLTKPRPGRRRFYIVMTVVTFSILHLTESNSVLNLFAKRPPLSMTNSEYSFFSAFTNVLLFAPALAVWLLKASDMCLILTGLIFMAIKNALTGLSTKKWMFLTARGIDGLTHLHFTGARSFLMKIVEPNETGRLFAAIGAIGHLSPLLGSTICNNLYAVTLNWFPGFVFLVSAAFCFLVLLIMSYVYIGIVRRGEHIGQDQSPATLQPSDNEYRDRDVLINADING